MSKHEVSCPICNADVPLSGEEAPGDEIYCAYCRAPLSVSGSGDDMEVEEDF